MHDSNVMDVIFDIDGTIADITHRHHYVTTKPKNWGAFYRNMHLDAPIVPMLRMIRSMSSSINPIWCTGRPEEYRQVTLDWLNSHHLQTRYLYMRAKGDNRQDTIVKEELLMKMRQDGFNPVMAFEDRKRIAEMWRKHGLVCAHVADGDF